MDSKHIIYNLLRYWNDVHVVILFKLFPINAYINFSGKVNLQLLVKKCCVLVCYLITYSTTCPKRNQVSKFETETNICNRKKWCMCVVQKSFESFTFLVGVYVCVTKHRIAQLPQVTLRNNTIVGSKSP